MDNPFFNPDAEVKSGRNRLPHWQQGSVFCFVTWRLADALPKTKLHQWNAERTLWLESHPEPWDAETEQAYHDRFPDRIDRWLDQGAGCCLLHKRVHAEVVSNTLHYMDNQKYALEACVVMPNHVHVLFRPYEGVRIAELLKTWKGASARKINQQISGSGSLWQPDYWDRLIRNENHFNYCRAYIAKNPAKAGLQPEECQLYLKQRRP